MPWQSIIDKRNDDDGFFNCKERSDFFWFIPLECETVEIDTEGRK